MTHSLSEVFTNGNPYLESLGVEVLEYGDGKAVMALRLQPEFMNSWHVAQGGISMTLMDVAMGLAARTAIPDAKSSATVDMSTSFLQPAGKEGETIVARGKVYHRSTTMCFCEAELWNGDKLVAKALGTFKAIKRVDIAKKLAHEANAATTEAIQQPGQNMKHNITIAAWSDLREHAALIRNEVFVIEQNVPAELEMDEMDAVCVHAVAYDEGGTPIATGRLLPDGHIGRMAVRKSGRGQGIGGAVLQALMAAARQRGDHEVVLNAQTHAASFYGSHGFAQEGEEFMEAGIAHIHMRAALV